jgi:hypothetical protein
MHHERCYCNEVALQVAETFKLCPLQSVERQSTPVYQDKVSCDLGLGKEKRYCDFLESLQPVAYM